jgi:hypothetical protein
VNVPGPSRRPAPTGAGRPRPSSQRPTELAGAPADPARVGGFLSLEFAMTLPVLAIVAALVLATGSVVRDVLVLQEAARVGARVASTTSGDQAVRWAVQDAAPELTDGPLTVRVSPALRRPGEQVQVEVEAERRYGPISQRLRARSTARVEPIIDQGATGPATPLRPIDPTAPRGPVPPPGGGP